MVLVHIVCFIWVCGDHKRAPPLKIQTSRSKLSFGVSAVWGFRASEVLDVRLQAILWVAQSRNS